MFRYYYAIQAPKRVENKRQKLKPVEVPLKNIDTRNLSVVDQSAIMKNAVNMKERF